MSVAVIGKQGTTLNVCPEGRLDAVRSPMLQKETEPYLADATQIVMDFSKVDYISSGGKTRRRGAGGPRPRRRPEGF